MSEKFFSFGPSQSTFDFYEIENQEVKTPLPTGAWKSKANRYQAFMSLAVNYTSIFRSIIGFGNYGYPMFLPFVMLRVVIAVPLCLIQLMLGKYVSGNLARAWSMCAFGKGVFYCFLLSSGFSAISNHLSIMYIVKFLYPLIVGAIPWKNCNPRWADFRCYEGSNFTDVLNKCHNLHSPDYCDNITWESSTKQFYKRIATNKTDVYVICVTGLILIILSLFILVINRRGISSAQKYFKLFVVCPICLAFIFAVPSFTIKSSSLGFRKTFDGEISSLFDLTLWSNALKNCLINYGLNTLSVTYLASNETFEDDMLHDLLVIVFSEVFSCIFLTLPIFTIIEVVRMHNYRKRRGIVVFRGSEDVFILMAEALLLYPPPVFFWGVVFFMLLILVSLGTQTILILALCSALSDCCRKFTNFFALLCTTLMMLSAFSMGFYFLPHNFDLPLSTVSVIVLLLGNITISFFYGVPRIMDDFHFMMGYIPSILIHISIYLAIGLLGTYLFFKLYYATLANPFVYIVSGVLFSTYVLSAILQVIRALNQGDIVKAFKADPNWGPSQPLLKRSRLVFNAKAITKEFMYRQALKRKHYQKKFDFSKQDIVFTIHT